MRMTKKQWEEDVVKLLNKLSSQGSLVERFEVNRLLDEHEKLEIRATTNRKSKEKRAMMNKVQGKEMIKVNKNDNDRLKELLKEAVTLI